MTQIQNPPANGRGADDLLAGDLLNSTTNGRDGAIDTEVRFAALLLSALPLATLHELMDPLSPEMFLAPIPRWVFEVATVCISEGASPDPGILHYTALRHRMGIPPAFRDHAVSELWKLHDMAPAAPSARYYGQMLRENHCRRLVELTLNRASAAAWSGELPEAIALAYDQLRALAALVAAGVGHDV